MNELRRRFGVLDGKTVPDLREEIERRESSPLRPSPASRRVAWPVITLAFVLVGAALLPMGRVLFGDSPNPLVASAEASTDPMRCDVRLRTPTVGPGEVVRLSFAYSNTGSESYLMSITRSIPGVIALGPAGQVVYDTSYGGHDVSGLQTPYRLNPGEHITLNAGFAALWGGPLKLVPSCSYAILGNSARQERVGEIRPSALFVDVVAQTPTTLSPPDALKRALAATGGLFDECRPTADGATVKGRILAPASYQDLAFPPLVTSCRALVHSFKGFAVVDLIFASPDDLQLGSELNESMTRGLEIPAGRSGAEMARWTFVVTSTGARSVAPDFTSDRRMGANGIQSIFTLPSSCGDPLTEALQCVPVGFTMTGGSWVAFDSYAKAGNRFTRTQIVPGVYFFAPVGSHLKSARVAERLVLETGEVLGRGWDLYAATTESGVGVGIEISDGPAILAFPKNLPGQCRVNNGSVRFDTPGGQKQVAIFGTIASDVAAVSVSFDDGSSVDAKVVLLPESLGANYDSFVAIADAGASVTGITLRDEKGTVLDSGPTDVCLSL